MAELLPVVGYPLTPKSIFGQSDEPEVRNGGERVRKGHAQGVWAVLEGAAVSVCFIADGTRV